MTVYELIDLYINSGENMQIWNGSTGQTVFEGSFEDAKDSRWADCIVESFGIEDGILVINIDEEE